MTDPADPLSDFADLRRAAIGYAQDASGEIWTDYNLHDPGVTLLEQTCFALSQIAYQTDLPTRDLLTNQRGHFCTQDLALFKPRKVLATDPVTRSDLAAWLCACPEIDSVAIAPPQPDTPGLFQVTIVPSQNGAPQLDPKAAFAEAFALVRPLCTALERVELAEPIDVRLNGTIEIKNEALPETVAAALYHKVAQILSGSDRQDSPATRADVWDAPERLLAPCQSRNEQSLDLGRHLARLRHLPGLAGIGELRLSPVDSEALKAHRPAYFRVVLPQNRDEMGLTLTLGGEPVSLSVTRLHEESVRISAETIALAAHHIDKVDWDVMRPGRTRSFSHSHVDGLLPHLFRAHGYRMHDPDTLVAEYRSTIDTVLRDMVNTLSTLPQRFTARPNSTADDPVRHRMQVDLLDYLIALQGCEMPATRHSGLHCYMSTRMRHRFEIDWRLEYLFALPALHRSRATGPGPQTPGGFLAELAILCDLDLSEDGQLTAPLQAYGLTLDNDALMFKDRDAEKFPLVPAHNPFDMLVPENDAVAVLDKDALTALSPFLADGRLSPALLARLSETDSFAIAPYSGGNWLILLDPGPDAALRQIGMVPSKAEALETVARLRATWRHVNRACEAAHLVEDILLGPQQAANTDVADLILPGWTARCQMESYRSYVQARVLALAPAHIYVRLHWLNFTQMQVFERLKTASLTGSAADLTALRDHLNILATKGGEQ